MRYFLQRRVRRLKALIACNLHQISHMRLQMGRTTDPVKQTEFRMRIRMAEHKVETLTNTLNILYGNVGELCYGYTELREQEILERWSRESRERLRLTSSQLRRVRA